MKLERAYSEIADIMPEERVLLNEPMKNHTTFGTGGPADLMVRPATKSQFKNAIRLLYNYEVPYMVIGRGSNLVVGDLGIRGAVIKLGEPFSMVSVDGDYITAEAGASNKNVVKAGHDNGLVGMEFFSWIPGSVGGAVVMNAGAHGGEVKQFLTEVEVMNGDFQTVTMSADELDMAYRTSNLQGSGKFVTKAVFRLDKGDVEQAKAYMAELGERRREKQPLEYPSAGSVFKRPVGYYAGQLIEESGLKGYTIGGAQVSEKHAGFIINLGNATSRDIFNLIRYVQETVYTRQGVRLETEVKLVGEF